MPPTSSGAKAHYNVTISTNYNPFSKSFSNVVENWLKI
jgi:hypothetical protein